MPRFDSLRKLFPALSALCTAALVSGGAVAEPSVGFIKLNSLSWQGGVASAETTHGNRLELGLDQKLQLEVEQALTRSKAIAGAALLVDPNSGQILAAAEIGSDPRGSLLFDPVAPAASVFKLVTTIALYERTSVTPLTQVCTKGGLRDIERAHLSPARGPDAICTKFAHALGVSRNAVYAQLATEQLMRTDLEEVANILGFGGPLTLDHSAKVGEVEIPYNDLEFAKTAAGFKNSRLSALGAAHIALSIAREGTSIPMHFTRAPGPASPSRVMSVRTARRLRDAMEVTIHSGTARSSFVDAHGKSTVGPVQVAGKTGTLQETPGGPTTSWFVGFAPSENPSIIVSVVLQNPVKWHRRGHEVARDLLRSYLAGLGVRMARHP